ncbi:hypothetical protein NL676_007314 [Syzygium grande]|nr:hypothetical protein NL676_007314 [Syzygium grande]
MSAQPPSIVLLLLRRLPSVLLCLHILTFELSNAQHCYDTGNFTATSDYAKNRELVLSSLPSEMASNGWFYSGNIGNGSDVVYVLSFCRGDSSNDTCFKCISSAAKDLIIKCPNQKAAWSLGTGDSVCIIRYADHPMYGVKQTLPTLSYYNTRRPPDGSGSVRSDMDELHGGAGSEGFDGDVRAQVRGREDGLAELPDLVLAVAVQPRFVSD